jgi:2-haloacid dehalogenase
MDYKCLLLDADDTLFDFQKAQRHALSQTLARFGVSGPVDSYLSPFKAINASLWRDFEHGRVTPEQIRRDRFSRLAEQLNLDFPPLPASELFVEYLGESTFLKKDALRVLKLLHPFVPMVLLTNGLSAVQRARISRSGIEPYFADIVISEEVGVQKPDRRIFTLAVERAGCTPDAAALMVGDSIRSDIAGALRAGYHACWLRSLEDSEPSDVRPTYTITRLAELPVVLGVSA